MMFALNFTCAGCGISDLCLLAEGIKEPSEMRDEYGCYLCAKCHAIRPLLDEVAA